MLTKEVYESREDMRNALKRIEVENKEIKKTLLKTLALNTEQVLRLEALKEEMKKLLDCCEFSHGAIVDAIAAEDGLDGRAGEKVIQMIEEQLTKHGIDFVKFKVSGVEDE